MPLGNSPGARRRTTSAPTMRSAPSSGTSRRARYPAPRMSSLTGEDGSSRRSGICSGTRCCADRATDFGDVGVMLLDRRDQAVVHAVGRAQLEFTARLAELVDRARLGARELRRLGDDRVQHGLPVERGVDRLADLAERAQLLDRLRQRGRAVAQFVEQPDILDGDDGLAREIGDQLDLLLAEWAHLLAVDGDRPDQLVLLEHRYGDQCADACGVDPRNRQWIAAEIGFIEPQVGDLDRLPALATRARVTSGPGWNTAPLPHCSMKAAGSGPCIAAARNPSPAESHMAP